MTGRRDENREIVRRKVERAADPPQRSARSGAWTGSYPVDGITFALAKAHKAAPDDDLVWLGLADLATRTGQFGDAGEWLTRCEQARPDDPAVWHARLHAHGHRPAVGSPPIGGPSAGLEGVAGHDPRAPRVARRAGRRHPGRAIGPRGAARPPAGRRRGPGAADRPRRAGRRVGTRRRAEATQGGDRQGVRTLPRVDQPPGDGVPCGRVRPRRGGDRPMVRRQGVVALRRPARLVHLGGGIRRDGPAGEGRAGPGIRNRSTNPGRSPRSDRDGEGGVRPRTPAAPRSPPSWTRRGAGGWRSPSRTAGPTSASSPRP